MVVMTNFQKLCKSLEEKIQAAYTAGVTLDEAEKLASEFLYAMMAVSTELKDADLDSRMKKAGVKGVRAALYLSTVQSSERKPTEAQIAAMIDVNEVVQGEQDGFDRAEVSRDELERYYQIFKEAHVHFRGVSKGKFEWYYCALSYAESVLLPVQ